MLQLVQDTVVVVQHNGSNHIVKCMTSQCMQSGYIFAMQPCLLILLSTHTALLTTFLVARAVSIFHIFEFEFVWLYTTDCGAFRRRRPVADAHQRSWRGKHRAHEAALFP